MPFVNNIIINKYCLQLSSTSHIVAYFLFRVGKANRHKSHNNEYNSKRQREKGGDKMGYTEY